jgi:hypothetical protein
MEFIRRVVLGIVFFAHGAQKMLGWFGGYGFTGTMGFFTGTMHIPAFFAFLAIAAEFFGGLGLVLGLLTRVAAFGIVSPAPARPLQGTEGPPTAANTGCEDRSGGLEPVVPLGTGAGDCHTEHIGSLAPSRISTVLAVEISIGRSPALAQEPASAHQHNGGRESELG